MKNRIKKASKILKQKLFSINFDKYEFHIGYENYLKNYIEMYDVIIQRYMAIIQNNFNNNDLKNKSFMDYGGGTGILSLLAKLAGIGYVCYVDISKDYADSFSKLAKEINIKVDDVLEHVYSPYTAYIELSNILNVKGNLLMASGANKYNPAILLITTITHLKKEPFWGESILKDKRKKIIMENFNIKSDDRLDLLVKKTRGLRKDDIIKYIYQLIEKNRKIPYKFSTNCCDPDTGFWYENLISFHNLSKKLKNEKSFSKVSISAGFYPEVKLSYSNPTVSENKIHIFIYSSLRFISLLLAKPLNFMIRILPFKFKFILAPYYILVVEKGNE